MKAQQFKPLIISFEVVGDIFTRGRLSGID